MPKTDKPDKFFLQLTYAQTVALIDVLTVLNVPSEFWKDLSSLYARSFQKVLGEVTKDGNTTEN